MVGTSLGGSVSQFNIHSSRKVNESCGNREDNNAFYHRAAESPFNVKLPKKCVILVDSELALLHALHDPLTNSETIDYLMLTNISCKNAIQNWGVYETVAAGNVKLGMHLISAHENGFGFNHLHREALKVSQDCYFMILSEFVL